MNGRLLHYSHSIRRISQLSKVKQKRTGKFFLMLPVSWALTLLAVSCWNGCDVGDLAVFAFGLTAVDLVVFVAVAWRRLSLGVEEVSMSVVGGFVFALSLLQCGCYCVSIDSSSVLDVSGSTKFLLLPSPAIYSVCLIMLEPRSWCIGIGLCVVDWLRFCCFHFCDGFRETLLTYDFGPRSYFLFLHLPDLNVLRKIPTW